MRLWHAVWLFCFCGAATAGHAATSHHYLTFINDGDCTNSGIDASATHEQLWVPLVIGEPLIGGEAGQSTVAMSTENGCVDNLRIRFRDQPTLTINGFNVCRNSTVHLGQAMRQALRDSDRDRTAAPAP